RSQDREKRQVGPLPHIKALYLLLGDTLVGWYIRCPAIGAMIECAQGLEGRLRSPFIEPLEQLLKMVINGKGFGFVDQAEPRAEGEDVYATPLTMEIPSALDLGEYPWIALGGKRGADLVPICTQPAEHLQAGGHPGVTGQDQVALQN